MKDNSRKPDATPLKRRVEAHNVCDERATSPASLIEEWIDEGERRVWFLFEASHRADSGGR